MKLTDRKSFDNLARQAQSDFEQLLGGKDWTVSVGISECSLAKGAQETFEHLRLSRELGIGL